MGIVSSAFLSLAIEFAWNFQRYLDPRYRYVEPKPSPEKTSAPLGLQINTNTNSGDSNEEEIPGNKSGLSNRAPEIISTHQENRLRRAAQLRYRRKRPSSFDATLIIKSMNKNGVNVSAGNRVVSSTPSTLKRQHAPGWNASSSSSSSLSSSSSVSSSEDSDLDVNDVKTEQNLEKNCIQPDENIDCDKNVITGEQEYTMSAAEEAAFRMTLGRGHFSRSKKDRFLNNLRLEKRMNDLNREFFELACRAHTRSLHRHTSGDLRKIV